MGTKVKYRTWKIIVCGTRTFNYYSLLADTLDEITLKMRDVIIITGAAKGADQLAEKWAFKNWFTVMRYHPDYQKYGKVAPIKRNQEMANTKAHLCIAFWDGKSRGTKDMIERARQAEIKTKIIRYEE